MSKVNLSLYKDIKVVELDTDKAYALIFPDYTSQDDFVHAVEKLKEIGLNKIISVHKNSDTKFVAMEPVDEPATK